MSSEEDSEFSLYSDKLLKKPKRTRQRVDAGEPRNSYSSIPNFSSRPNFFPTATNYYNNYFVHPQHHHQQNHQQQYQNQHQHQQQQQQQYFNLFCSQTYTTNIPSVAPPQHPAVANTSLAPKMLNELLCNRQLPSKPATNTMLQTVQQTSSVDHNVNVDTTNNNNNINNNNNNNNNTNNNKKYDCGPIVNDNQVTQTNISPTSSPSQTISLMPNPDFANHMLRDILQNRKHELLSFEHEFRNNNHITNNNNNDEIVKREETQTQTQNQNLSDQQNDSVNAIVEDILLNNSMLTPKIEPPISPTKLENIKKVSTETDLSPAQPPLPVVNGCKKRKLYQPQQHADKFIRLNDQVEDEDDISDECDENEINGSIGDDEDGNEEDECLDFGQKKLEKSVLKSQLRTMQEQLVDMQQKYVQLCTKIDKEKDGDDQDDKNLDSNENSPKQSTQPQSPLQPHQQQLSSTPIETNRMNGLFHHHHQNQNPMAAAAAAMYFGHKLFFDQSAKETLNNNNEDRSEKQHLSPEKSSQLVELEHLADTLKNEITSSLSNLIDSIVSRYLTQKRQNYKNNSEKINETHHNNIPASMSKPINGSFQSMLQTLKMHHHHQQQQHQQQQELHQHLRPNLQFLHGANKQQPLINSAAAAAAALYAMNHHNLSLQQKLPNHTAAASTNSKQSSAAYLDHRNGESNCEQNEALSLVVTPKKKRHKVTDTRITPRTVSRILAQDSLNGMDHNGGTHNSCPSPRSTSLFHQQSQHHPIVSTNSTVPSSSILPSSLPTSVAIPNPQLHESQVFSPYSPFFHNTNHTHNMSMQASSSPPGMKNELETSPVPHPSTLLHPALLAAAHHRASPDYNHLRTNSSLLDGYDRNSDCNSADLSFDGAHSSTLTPMHLRKAKLMFFWVRYPSSSVLKMYFPDIKFNKNNTAQLVKWFSNFREFYYIQMEKYARQAVSEGVKNVEDINVATDSEIYRVLNLHYNRNNHIEVCGPQVPSNFRFVVEQTLREFFKAISTGKDTEQSWKKSIYKVISRLDDSVPEYFKSPNFLEQLE